METFEVWPKLNSSIIATETRHIDYIGSHMKYADFFTKYLLPNKPCLFGPWMSGKWSSRKDWVNEETEKPSFVHLASFYGSVKAPVANCNSSMYNSHAKEQMDVKEFLQYMIDYRESNYSKKMQCLYLKDWHFALSSPNYSAYETPECFQSDWLNEYMDGSIKTDDYRFVYIGPKGSWTPFHSDVMRSYSWSANVAGKKKWILFPPGEELFLTNTNGQLVFDLTSNELDDKKTYPNIERLKYRYEVVQHSGEVIFVPSGWHHQVFNLEDTISINHNWINGCNIVRCWEFIKDNLSIVEQEIMDCKDMEDWDSHCQVMLKVHLGIDYNGFYRLIHLIVTHRMEVLLKLQSEPRSSKCHQRACQNLPFTEKEEKGSSSIHQSNPHHKFDVSKAYGNYSGSQVPQENTNKTKKSEVQCYQGVHACACSNIRSSSIDMFDNITSPICKEHYIFDLSVVRLILIDMISNNELVASLSDQAESSDKLLGLIDQILLSK